MSSPTKSGASDSDNPLHSLPPSVSNEISRFLSRIRRQQVTSPQDMARKTLEIMRAMIASLKKTPKSQGDITVQALILMIKRAGCVLMAAVPHELVIGNMVRRVLAIVREEAAAAGKAASSGAAASGIGGGNEDDESESEGSDASDNSYDDEGGAFKEATSAGPSLLKLLDAPEASEIFSKPAKMIKNVILEGINELIDELSSVSAHIAEQAIEHIHANEVILTAGRDATVEAFLKAAHKKRTFEVIVAETAGRGGAEGHLTATALAEAGISVTLIADAAVFAMMARVNKVIVGAHAVMANGGLIATAGCHMLALAALHSSVPLVACAGLYKLTPLFPAGPDEYNVLLSPQPMVAYEEGLQGVHVPNPAYDYVPPELVALHITNIGANHASYVYRLLAEYYHEEDHDLSVEAPACGKKSP
jgi:translation initiation factor eIF-2B subunit beta